MEFTREIMQALGAPFPEEEVDFLPRGSANGKARALAYIDARSVMSRLDAVVGPGNWSYDFDLLAGDGKMVKGRLTVLGVTKCDAGEADGEDEALKSAVSDALKRAAVHFGIGRYLYHLPAIWAPFDSQKRRWVESPRLDPRAVDRALALCGLGGSAPAAAAPGRRPAPAPAPVAAAPAPVAAAPVAAAPAREEAPAERPATDEGAGDARRSIWAAGAAGERPAAAPSSGNGNRVRETAPESSGDRAAARVEARPAAGIVETPRPELSVREAAPSAPACSSAGCGKALTKGQHDVSVRAFGEPLCPACQKDRARAAA